MDLQRVNQLEAMFNRMLAPTRAMERESERFNRMLEPVRIAQLGADDIVVDYPGLAEAAETEPAPVRAAELLEELLEEQRHEAEEAARARHRDGRRQRWTFAISVGIAAASLLVAIAVAVVK
jgi:hypothetical protein